MPNVMMQLGGYQFSIDNAAYQSLTRSTEYRWARQAQIGSHDALQFTGYGTDKIDLEGVIYPHFRGGVGQIDKMRAQAGLGLPMPLVSGSGKILGLWVITSIGEGQEIFAKAGVPRRQTFTLGIEKYGGSLRSFLRHLRR